MTPAAAMTDSAPGNHRAASRREEPPPGCGVAPAAWALLVMLGTVVAGGAQAAAPEALTVYRSLFPEAARAEPQPLEPGREVELRGERRRVSGVSRLRIVSSDPEVQVALRFRPQPEPQGALALTAIVVLRPGLARFLVLEGTQAIAGGALTQAGRTRIGEGLATELAGEPGAVHTLVLQDEGGAEFRLRQEGEVLTVGLILPAQGGRPVGVGKVWYADLPLTYLDFDIQGAAGSGNALGELHVGPFAGAANAFFKTGETRALERITVRQQLMRWETLAIWLEGGAGFLQHVRDSDGLNEAQATWSFGAALHYRSGDWGALAQLSTFSGPLLTVVAGGWQLSPALGISLALQAFESFQGLSLGLGIDF